MTHAQPLCERARRLVDRYHADLYVPDTDWHGEALEILTAVAESPIVSIDNGEVFIRRTDRAGQR